MNCFAKLNKTISQNQSLLVVGLDPNPEMLPRLGNRFILNTDNQIDNLQAWLEWVIEQTRELVAAYKLNLGFYQALGVAGLALLHSILKRIPPQYPVILDAKHGDLNTSSVFAQTIFTQWGIDAVTLTPYAGQDHVAPFLVHGDKAVFVLCHTSNPGALALQNYPHPDNPLYLEIVKQVQSWGTMEQAYLEVGSNDPEIIKKIRTLAPERLILLRSIWTEGADLEQIIRAGLDANGEGLLIPISLDLLAHENLAQSVANLNQQVEQIRSELITAGSSCELWTSNVCLFNQHPHQELILQLFDIGCLLFGEYVQASGETDTVELEVTL